MKFYLILLLALLNLKVVIGQSKKGIVRITIETLKENAIGKDVQLIDVRRPEEYAKGYIDDAININMSDIVFFKKEVSKLDKTKPIYLYCYSGVRSHRVAKVVAALGFEEVYDFSGGWKVWSQQW